MCVISLAWVWKERVEAVANAWPVTLGLSFSRLLRCTSSECICWIGHLCLPLALFIKGEDAAGGDFHCTSRRHSTGTYLSHPSYLSTGSYFTSSFGRSKRAIKYDNKVNFCFRLRLSTVYYKLLTVKCVTHITQAHTTQVTFTFTLFYLIHSLLSLPHSTSKFQHKVSKWLEWKLVFSSSTFSLSLS